MLTQQRLKELLHYCPETGYFTWLVNKKSAKAGDICGSATNQPYVEIHIDGRKYMGHRLAFLYMTGSFPEHNVDHVNGDGKNNTWINLREASTSQNAMNKKASKNNKVGIKNVRYRKDRDKYQVIVEHQGVAKSFGMYKDLEEAKKVAINARVSVHGEFAYQGETK